MAQASGGGRVAERFDVTAGCDVTCEALFRSILLT